MSKVKYPVAEEHIEKITDWYENNNKRLFIISGYAGCGKTTLARSIPELLDVKAVFLAPTGKAALVIGNGSTIHSYLYKVIKDPVTEEPHFVRKALDDFTEELLIIDEISMVSDDLMKDLQSINIPIIGLGDSAQLPPVNGTSSVLDRADIFLTEVFRNDGGILDLATDIRRGNAIQRKYENVKFISRKFIEDMELVDEDSIVICKYNNTRQTINSLYRSKIKKYSLVIEVGEKLIITRNNKDTGLMNGSIVTLEKIRYIDKDQLLARVSVIDDRGYSLTITLDLTNFFKQPDRKRNYQDNVHYADYAYAITCHKAQGSEFDKVFIINEGKKFSEHKSWLYTAVTRAKKEVRIYNFG